VLAENVICQLYLVRSSSDYLNFVSLSIILMTAVTVLVYCGFIVGQVMLLMYADIFNCYFSLCLHTIITCF